jgi:metal-responsive CopG/Arc/MetJ family transcriptional regulator
MEKTMVRTQIYLTEQEQSALRQLSRQFKQSQSELIRQAIDRFIEESQRRDRSTILQAAAGLWSDTKPLEDVNFQALRAEADRMNPEFRE